MINTQLNDLRQCLPSLTYLDDMASLKNKIERDELCPYISNITTELFECLLIPKPVMPDANPSQLQRMLVRDTDYMELAQYTQNLIHDGYPSQQFTFIDNTVRDLPCVPTSFVDRLLYIINTDEWDEMRGVYSYIPTGNAILDHVYRDTDMQQTLLYLCCNSTIIPLVRQENDNSYIYHVLSYETETQEVKIVKIGVNAELHRALIVPIFNMGSRHGFNNKKYNILLKGYATNLLSSYNTNMTTTETIINPTVDSVITRLPKANIDNIRRSLGIAIPNTPEVVEEQQTVATPQNEDIYTNTEVKETFIPENSQILSYHEHTSRFSGAMWFDRIQKADVALAGLGGIGSYVAFLLSRLQISSLSVYDDDIVDASNISGQLYSFSDIGLRKTTAVNNRAIFTADYHKISTFSHKFTNNDRPEKIMICGFDNMAARNTFYKVWKTYVLSLPEEERGECLFIDGRLATEYFQVFCIVGNHPLHMQRYEEKYLFSDEEAEQTVCSYKQTSFCANMIASVMVNIFVNFIANLCHPIINRAVPFCTEYDGQFMMFNSSY